MKLVSETVWYTKKEKTLEMTRRPLVQWWNRLFNGWVVADSMQPWASKGTWTPPKKLLVQVWEVDND